VNLEDQVCSLELSKRLKELGVRQGSLFFWTSGGVASRLEALPILEINYSAFTVAELGQMLPEDYISCKTEGAKFPAIEYKKYWLCYYDLDGCGSDIMQMEESEANARAKMLIYLLENKLMELKNE
jgi:hypothetical protein